MTSEGKRKEPRMQTAIEITYKFQGNTLEVVRVNEHRDLEVNVDSYVKRVATLAGQEMLHIWSDSEFEVNGKAVDFIIVELIAEEGDWTISAKTFSFKRGE